MNKPKKIPWNKGLRGIYSEETRRSMGEKNIGRSSWNKGLIGPQNHRFGKKQTKESNTKRSLALRGRTNGWFIGKPKSEATKEKIRQARLKNNPGAIKPGEVRGIKPRGPNHPNWKGGIARTNNRKLVHHNEEYVLWRRSVFERDGFACRYCLEKNVKFHAHHILPWSKYPEHRFNINNGLTLCRNCHLEVHKKK